MVPLAEAWDSGASYLDRRDPRGLRQRPRRQPQPGRRDRQGRTRPRATRTSPSGCRRKEQCRYLREFVAVKLRWRLSVDSAEKSAMGSLAAPAATSRSRSPAPADAPGRPDRWSVRTSASRPQVRRRDGRPQARAGPGRAVGGDLASLGPPEPAGARLPRGTHEEDPAPARPAAPLDPGRPRPRPPGRRRRVRLGPGAGERGARPVVVASRATAPTASRSTTPTARPSARRPTPRRAAECSEYDTASARLRCRVEVRTWYRDLGDLKRSLAWVRRHG